MVKRLLERFIKKSCKKNQEKFRIEKVIKKKERRYMLNGIVMIIHLIAGSIKKILYKTSQYFTQYSKPDE